MQRWPVVRSAGKTVGIGGVTDLPFDGLARCGAGERKIRLIKSPARREPALLADEDLMAAIARGDRAAARELMQRNTPRLLGLAHRMLNDPVEAEDIVQETFIRVWKAAERWESGRAKVSTWLSRIAINLCYDRMRRRREQLVDELPDQVDHAPSQESSLVQAQSGNRVAHAVAGLPERQRMALELVHFQEMTNIEAAEIMEVSVEAMESLLARGRRKLKSVLLAQADDLIESYTGESPFAMQGVQR